MNLAIPAPVYISETGFNCSRYAGGEDMDEFEKRFYGADTTVMIGHLTDIRNLGVNNCPKMTD